MNPWHSSPTSSPLSEATATSPEREQVLRRRGSGWRDCLRKDAEHAAERLAAIRERQLAANAVPSVAGSTYRVPPSTTQRAMTFYASKRERRRFLTARPLTPLWPHQKDGVDFMRRREQEGAPCGGIIAYKMRAGKTLMIGAHILEDLQALVRAGEQRFGQPTLFLTPPQALQTIAGQIAQHIGPSLNTVVISSQDHDADEDMLELVGSADLIITSYSHLATLHRRRPTTKTTLLTLRYRRVVADEAHVFCNQDIQLFQVVMRLEAYARWFVTGTPIRNAVADLLSPLAFLRVPTPLPALESAAFRELLHRIMIRHYDGAGGDDSVDDVVVRLDFASAIEQRLYKQAQTHTQMLLRNTRSSSGALALILRLRQICVDPHLIAGVASASMHENYVFERYGSATWSADSFLQDAMAARDLADATSLPDDPRRRFLAADTVETLEAAMDRIVPLVATKILYIFKYYETFVERTNEKLVIFSSWAGFLKRLARLFDLRARLRGEEASPYLLVHGKVDRREELFHAFQTDNAHRVLLLTTGTGGVSLDLTRANHAILVDLWFNPFVISQAISRLFGVNQTRPVHIRRLCIRGTIDEQILQLAEAKSRLEDILVPASSSTRPDDDEAAATPIPDDSMALLVAWILNQQTEGKENALKRKHSPL